LIEQLTQHCSNPRYSILTAYPVGYELSSCAKGTSSKDSFHVPNNETRGTALVPWKFDSDGMLRQKGKLLGPECSEPVLCQMFAAGFCFGMAEWMMQDCPYDGKLHHFFFGEEQSMAVRLYTHGYDMYAPPESVCYHLWSRSHRPPPPTTAITGSRTDGTMSQKQMFRQKSQEIVRRQLEGYNGLGMGCKRTVDDWARSLKVDLVNKTVEHDNTVADELKIGQEGQESKSLSAIEACLLPVRKGSDQPSLDIFEGDALKAIRAFLG